jgi:2-methylcitrate dehydratase PrpD
VNWNSLGSATLSPEDAELEEPVVPRVARWVSDRADLGGAFTAEDRAMARLSLLDHVGCMVAGSRGPGPVDMLRSVTSTGGDFLATLVGSGTKASASDAAMINAVAANALELDDTLFPFGHIGTMVVPAALAVSELRRRSGVELLDAISVGYETSKFMSVIIRPNVSRNGTDYIAYMGSFGALPAAAYLARLDENQVETAFGILGAIGATMPYGTYGSDAHLYQTGRAVGDSVHAVLLAGEGFTSLASILDLPQGGIAKFRGDQSDSIVARRLQAGGIENHIYPKDIPLALAEALRRLHSGRYAMARTVDSQTIKVYPSMGNSHIAIEAALELRARIGAKVESIESIEIEVPRPFMRMNGPLTANTARDARFSTSILVALALVDGKVTLSELADESLRRPVVQDLAQKVSYTVNDRFTDLFIDTWPEGEQCWPTAVTIVTPKETLRSEQFSARGGPQKPLSYADVVAKFIECARYGRLAESSIERTLQIMERIEKLEDVTELLDAVRGRSEDSRPSHSPNRTE